MPYDPSPAAHQRADSPLRPRRSLAARAYVWLGPRAVSIALVCVIVGFGLTLTLGFGLFEAWQDERQRARGLESELHRRWADDVARQLDRLADRTQRLREFNLAAARAGLLSRHDLDAVGQFFWDQLESAPETGYLGLLSLEGPVSGIGVRRREAGRLRVESVAFREPADRTPRLFEPFPARQRQFFRLDPAGRPTGRIVEHDFNSPWDSNLETALRQAQDQDWRGLFGWALGDPVPGLDVEAIFDDGENPVALLAVAPAFGDLSLPEAEDSAVDVRLLDVDGRILARSEATVGTGTPRPFHMTPWIRGDGPAPTLWIATRVREGLGSEWAADFVGSIP